MSNYRLAHGEGLTWAELGRFLEVAVLDHSYVIRALAAAGWIIFTEGVARSLDVGGTGSE